VKKFFKILKAGLKWIILVLLGVEIFSFLLITATNLLVFYIYQHGFQYFRLGFAAASAVAMFGLVYALSALISLWFNR